MYIFERTVQYYETDKMGITHHSNYIKWMEEARMYYLDKIGLPFTEIEKHGVVSPVVSVNIKYKSPSTFGDLIKIETRIKSYNSIKLEVSYKMTKVDGTIVAEGTSVHCFVKDGSIVVMDRSFPDVDEKFRRNIDG